MEIPLTLVLADCPFKHNGPAAGGGQKRAGCAASGRDFVPFPTQRLYFWPFISLCSLRRKATFNLKRGLAPQALNPLVGVGGQELL